MTPAGPGDNTATALGVAWRVDLDLHQAVSRAVRQPAAAPGMHADRSPRLVRGPGDPADTGARHVDLEVSHPEPEFAGVDLDPSSGRAPAEQRVGPGGDRAHVVVADREPFRFPGRFVATGCLELRDDLAPGDGIGLAGLRHAPAGGRLDLVVRHRFLDPVASSRRPATEERSRWEEKNHTRAAPLLSSTATASAGPGQLGDRQVC